MELGNLSSSLASAVVFEMWYFLRCILTADAANAIADAAADAAADAIAATSAPWMGSGIQTAMLNSFRFKLYLNICQSWTTYRAALEEPLQIV